MTKNKYGKFRFLLLALSLLATLKMIFAAVGLDEEYQLVMSYRNASGDKLFLNMWEPHQSSAFLCTLLLKPYLALFGSTGLILYLRVWGTLFHLGISVYLNHVLKNIIEEKYAWLLALLYYNIIPKQIILPEFGIMQVWSYTLLTLFLFQYYIRGRKKGRLIPAGIALALNVLSYPSCLILYPFVLFLLYRLSGPDKWRDMGILTLVCVLCALGYLGMLFSYMAPGDLPAMLSHILGGDVTHSLSMADKFLFFLEKGLYELIVWTGCLLSALLFLKWRKAPAGGAPLLAVLPACLVQLFYWVVLNTGYEALHIHLITFVAAGLWAGGKKTSGTACRPAVLLRYGIWGAVLSLLAVVYLTDISLTESIPHAMPAAVYAGALLFLPGSSRPEQRENSGYGRQKTARLMLLFLLFTCIFGKAYTLRAGSYSNVLQSSGIMKEGPAAGTVTSYIAAYVYHCDYEDWNAFIQDGDKVLIKVDQIQTLSTIQYLFKDVEISHFSIVNPTAYDERLLEYWELYPEKAPNVIIVDCWYGELMTDPEGWLMQYIENDFGYTQVHDGSYIRIFRK